MLYLKFINTWKIIVHFLLSRGFQMSPKVAIFTSEVAWDYIFLQSWKLFFLTIVIFVRPHCTGESQHAFSVFSLSSNKKKMFINTRKYYFSHLCTQALSSHFFFVIKNKVGPQFGTTLQLTRFYVAWIYFSASLAFLWTMTLKYVSL